MWKKIAIGGAIAAATLGAGTAALAASGSTTSGTPAPTTPAAGAKHHAGKELARRALHGQWVTGKAGSSSFVTHDEIRGEVTAVLPTSITVRSADKVSQTYVVNSATKVRMRSAGKGAASSIGQVKSGDHVLVIGTGTGTALTAQGIVDVKK